MGLSFSVSHEWTEPHWRVRQSLPFKTVIIQQQYTAVLQRVQYCNSHLTVHAGEKDKKKGTGNGCRNRWSWIKVDVPRRQQPQPSYGAVGVCWKRYMLTSGSPNVSVRASGPQSLLREHVWATFNSAVMCLTSTATDTSPWSGSASTSAYSERNRDPPQTRKPTTNITQLKQPTNNNNNNSSNNNNNNTSGSINH